MIKYIKDGSKHIDFTNPVFMFVVRKPTYMLKPLSLVCQYNCLFFFYVC